MRVRFVTLHRGGQNFQFEASTPVTVDKRKVFTIIIRDALARIKVADARPYRVHVYKHKMRREVPLLAKEHLLLESADRVRIWDDNRKKNAIFLIWTGRRALRRMTSTVERVTQSVNTFLP